MGDVHLAADPLVPELCEALGRLDPEPVEVEIVVVAIGREELLAELRRAGAHRHHGHRDHVALLRLDRAEEVGDAQRLLVELPREGDPQRLALVVGVVDDQVVVVGLAGEVAVDDLRREELVARRPLAPDPELGLGLTLDEGVVLGLAQRAAAVLPLADEERLLVDVAEDLAEIELLRADHP